MCSLFTRENKEDTHAQTHINKGGGGGGTLCVHLSVTKRQLCGVRSDRSRVTLHPETAGGHKSVEGERKWETTGKCSCDEPGHTQDTHGWLLRSIEHLISLNLYSLFNSSSSSPQ